MIIDVHLLSMHKGSIIFFVCLATVHFPKHIHQVVMWAHVIFIMLGWSVIWLQYFVKPLTYQTWDVTHNHNCMSWRISIILLYSILCQLTTRNPSYVFECILSNFYSNILPQLILTITCLPLTELLLWVDSSMNCCTISKCVSHCSFYS